MRPLIIIPETINAIGKLVDYAEKNPFTMDDLLDIKNGDMECAGENINYMCTIPVGFKVVYSIEKQPKGDVRHLSMSVSTAGRVPNFVAVQEIMNLIGFDNKLDKCLVRMEKLKANHEAINVWEIIKEP